MYGTSGTTTSRSSPQTGHWAECPAALSVMLGVGTSIAGSVRELDEARLRQRVDAVPVALDQPLLREAVEVALHLVEVAGELRVLVDLELERQPLDRVARPAPGV